MDYFQINAFNILKKNNVLLHDFYKICNLGFFTFIFNTVNDLFMDKKYPTTYYYMYMYLL